jgi:hypothetical protein
LLVFEISVHFYERLAGEIPTIEIAMLRKHAPKIAKPPSSSALFFEQSKGLGMGVEYEVFESMVIEIVFTSVHFLRLFEYSREVA